MGILTVLILAALPPASALNSILVSAIMVSLLWLALGLFSANASPILEQRADNTAIVNLAASRGPSKHAASGFIYGIPDNSGQIPSH